MDIKKSLSSFFTNILLFQEIGAALLNLRSGLVESEFHEYVRPKMHPSLSEYCINLTRITQELIDRQDTFTDVYPRFINWLDGISTEKNLRFAEPNQRSTKNNRNASFCTWTKWDKILQSFGNLSQLTTSLMLIYFFFYQVGLGTFFSCGLSTEWNSSTSNVKNLGWRTQNFWSEFFLRIFFTQISRLSYGVSFNLNYCDIHSENTPRKVYV